MTADDYSLFAKAIREAGFFTNGLEDMDGWHRTAVCSKQRVGGGYAGNSIWITRLANRWYLGTWGGWLYCFGGEEEIVELCVEWLSREPDTTHGDFASWLKTEFDLSPVTPVQFDAVIEAK